MFLPITRFFSTERETQYQARRYKRELIRDSLDRTQVVNTCSKIITLAQIQVRLDDDAHDQEQRIPEHLREKNRSIIHEMGVTEYIYKDIGYHGKNEKVVRAGLECLSIMVQHKPVIEYLTRQGILDERLYHRRLNKIPGDVICLYKPKPRRGLAGMVTAFKSTPEYLALHGDAGDQSENISEAQRELNKSKSDSAFVNESIEAINYAEEAGLCPTMPLRLKIWIYRFRTNDHVQQCAGRFTSAFRGFYHPYDTIAKIRKQIYAHYNLPEELLPPPKPSPFEVKTRRRSAKRKKKKKKNKYEVYIQGMDTEDPDEQYEQFKLKKGDRVVCKAQKWWPRWYDGVIAEVTAPKATSTSVENRYTVEFDDGEVSTFVEEFKIKRKQKDEFEANEYLQSLLGIISSPRWMVKADICKDALFALFLLFETKNEKCGWNRAIEHGCLENIIQIMKMHHEDASVQIKCSYVLDSIARSSIKNCKAVANAGAIQYVLDNLKGIKFAHSTLDAQKASLWVVDAMSLIRSNLEEMENFGGQYILTACRRVKDLIMTRRVKRIDWLKLREKRLLGNDDDEIQQRNYLIKLFCPCVHMMHVGKGECHNPRHCKECFINNHSKGFWHREGCDKHPGNTDVPTLLEMTQLRKLMENFDKNPPAKKPQIPLKEYKVTKSPIKSAQG